MKKGSAENRKSHSSRKWYKRESRSSPVEEADQTLMCVREENEERPRGCEWSKDEERKQGKEGVG